MQVVRKTNIETKEFKVGDQIKINLKNYGEFNLTAQKVTKDGTYFMFDSIITKRQMNNDWTNEGGFEKSELNKWMQLELLESFPDEIKSRIVMLSVPTYGQIFGHDEFYGRFEPDTDEQFELMKDIKNRIATYDNDTDWYWLRNATKKNVSSRYFVAVGYVGHASYNDADDDTGVLPVILLR